jgi:uncharacterized protein YndB with AHSA1/START domain
MSPPTQLILEQTFAAPRARVFDAWSNPEVLRRWWGAGADWTAPAVEVDLRTGGRYRLSMEDPGGGRVYTVGGEYIEVAPHERLVYTWSWETPGSPTGDLTTVVTVEFVETAPDRTTVILAHTGFGDVEQRDRHDEGWRACLANLHARIFPTETP